MIKDKFIYFLIENDIFDEYVKYTEAYLIGSIFKDVDDFLDKQKPKVFIAAAFRWFSTPEGHEYWDAINTTWRGKL